MWTKGTVPLVRMVYIVRRDSHNGMMKFSDFLGAVAQGLQQGDCHEFGACYIVSSMLA